MHDLLYNILKDVKVFSHLQGVAYPQTDRTLSSNQLERQAGLEIIKHLTGKAPLDLPLKIPFKRFRQSPPE